VLLGLAIIVLGAFAANNFWDDLRPQTTKQEFEDSIKKAGLYAPDLGVALAAVGFKSSEDWGLDKNAARDLLQKAIFVSDQPEISTYGRSPLGVTRFGNDIDGRPYAILSNGRIRPLMLSGLEVLANDEKMVPKDEDMTCRLNGREFVGTNREVYLYLTEQKSLDICKNGSEFEIPDTGRILAAALHPLGNYIAYVNADLTLTVQDIVKQDHPPLWQIKLPADEVSDVTALALGSGMLAIGGCSDPKCRTSTVVVYDWDHQPKTKLLLKTPNVRAIALF
jgi:hypothetical protein